eukprot:11323173-Ditylum_brightwellii.AAC.1
MFYAFLVVSVASFAKGLLYPCTQPILQRFLLYPSFSFWVFLWLASQKGCSILVFSPYYSHVKALFTPPFFGVSVASSLKGFLYPHT